MSIMAMGNRTIGELEDDLGIKFSQEDFDFLNNNRQEDGRKIPDDKFHVFEKPYMVVCGFDVYDKVVEILKRYSGDFNPRVVMRVIQMQKVEKRVEFKNDEETKRLWEEYLELEKEREGERK